MWIPFAVLTLAGAAFGSLIGPLVILVALDVLVQASGLQPQWSLYLSIALLILLLPGIGAIIAAYLGRVCEVGSSTALFLKIGGVAGLFFLLNSPTAFEYLLVGVEVLALGEIGKSAVYSMGLISGAIFCGGTVVAAICLVVAALEVTIQWIGVASGLKLGVPIPSLRLILIVLILSLSVHLISDFLLEAMRAQTVL